MIIFINLMLKIFDIINILIPCQVSEQHVGFWMEDRTSPFFYQVIPFDIINIYIFMGTIAMGAQFLSSTGNYWIATHIINLCQTIFIFR